MIIIKRTKRLLLVMVRVKKVMIDSYLAAMVLLALRRMLSP